VDLDVLFHSFFVFIACNGNIIFATTSMLCLTCWLEEWYLYFKWTWGRTNIRYRDMAAKYKIEHGLVLKVVRHNWAILLKAQQSWPFFASFEDDAAL
jgi:hypothetical protein